MIGSCDFDKVRNQSRFCTNLLNRIDALPSVDVPHWIPCSERLPEKDGLYLVTTSKRQVQVHVFNHTGNSKEYWNRCNMAWMPLPAAYREEEQDG